MPEWLLALGVAIVAASGGVLASRYGRVAALEKRVARLDALNRKLWVYLRAQIDHSYRSGVQPLPLPDDLFGDDES
ncbi:hypothetical protein [Leifsonia poae]|uniref:hypothetical protein n=1 Tax=Leifsonia poae TaxID=110933 RepID=UPI001CBB78A5|nr:hypothetical protein [Leifsonia poae]